MKKAGNALINHSAELIVLISSVVMIAFMITGGCGGNGSNPRRRRPQDSPPECNGTFGVDLSCPAESLAGSTCLPHGCEVVDNSGSIPEPVDTIQIIFGSSCTDTDYFTLECRNLRGQSGIFAEEASISIDSVNDIPVSPDVEGQADYGLPKGTIFTGDNEYLLDCNSYTVP
jgi:hypothetical protein